MCDDIIEVAAMIHPDSRDFIEAYSRAQEVIDQYNDALTTGEARF